MSILDKVVEFIINERNNSVGFGIVIEKQNIIFQDSIVTGYIIQSVNNRLHHVPYKNILKIVPEEENQTTTTTIKKYNKNDLRISNDYLNEILEKNTEKFKKNQELEDEEDDLPF